MLDLMDPLTHLLDGPRARRAFVLRLVMRPPWALRVEDEAPLTVFPVLTGEVWFRPDGGLPLLMRAGDVLVVRGPTPYTLSTDRDAVPLARIGPGQTCTGPGGRDLSSEQAHSLRTWGNDAGGSDRMVVGTYSSVGEVGRSLLEGLPAHLVVHDPAPQLVRLLDLEAEGEDLGQNSVLDRLLDVLLITTVRAWARAEPDAGGLTVPQDPVVAHALRLIHGAPERAWTVAELAEHTGVARATFARRFRDLLGAPPMTYLTRWRLTLGADLVADGTHTLETVAREVGYADAFAFSAAFKRHHGVSPSAYRARLHAGATTASSAARVSDRSWG